MSQYTITTTTTPSYDRAKSAVIAACKQSLRDCEARHAAALTEYTQRLRSALERLATDDLSRAVWSLVAETIVVTEAGQVSLPAATKRVLRLADSAHDDKPEDWSTLGSRLCYYTAATWDSGIELAYEPAKQSEMPVHQYRDNRTSHHALRDAYQALEQAQRAVADAESEAKWIEIESAAV